MATRRLPSSFYNLRSQGQGDHDGEEGENERSIGIDKEEDPAAIAITALEEGPSFDADEAIPPLDDSLSITAARTANFQSLRHRMIN